MDRRTFIGTLAALPAVARAGEVSADAAASAETIALWPGDPPGAEQTHPVPLTTDAAAGPAHNRVITGVAQPVLHVVRPQQPDGSAFLIAPGGGYRQLWIDNEGFDVAQQFSGHGITSFVLVYRLPAEGWLKGRDVPLEDAQRAIRFVRANAARFGVDSERVGIIGFSAGGHVAASLATRFAAPVYNPQDDTDTLNARPAFATLLYPVITMLPPFAHEASCEMLLGASPSDALRAQYSCERLVTRDTPPMFLAAALDDDYVAPENTLAMLAALRAAKVAAECHLFERGGHGFGIHGAAGLPAANWPELFLKWAASRGYVRSA